MLRVLQQNFYENLLYFPNRVIFGYPYSSTIMSGVSAAWCPQQRSRLMPSRTHSRAATTHAKPHAQQQLARDLEVERAAMGQRSRPQSSGPGLLCAGTSALCVNLCLTDRVWVNRPKRTSNHERLCIQETAGTPSVTPVSYTHLTLPTTPYV